MRNTMYLSVDLRRRLTIASCSELCDDCVALENGYVCEQRSIIYCSEHIDNDLNIIKSRSPVF